MIKPAPGIQLPFRLAMIVLGALILSLGACARSGANSLVILDPVLPVLNPKAAELYGRYGQKSVTLPYEASETLYAVLAEEQASVVYLSPLLAPELHRILDSSPATRLVYAGGFEPVPRAGLYSAAFSPDEAAAAAGKALVEQARSLPPEALCAAVFLNGSDEAITRFADSYLAGKPGNTPIIENISSPWSSAAADRLKILDIRLAYIAVSGKESARWAREVFDETAYVLVEAALGGIFEPSVDAWLVWDLDASLKALTASLETEPSASLTGTWKVLGR